MKSHTKAAAVSAFKWALGLSLGFILGPVVTSLASGTELSGNQIGQKLIAGIVLFPILFLGLWVWGAFSKKDPFAGLSFDINKGKTPTTVQDPDHRTNGIQGRPNKWNYVFNGMALFMLLFLFIPEIIRGTLANIYYLGAAFWVGVIVYCSLNILRKAKNNS